MLWLKCHSPFFFAIVEGGSSNPEINSALRGAIEEAQRRDVPRATIRNFLKKLSEAKEKTVVQRHTFEGKLYKKLLVIITFFPESLGHTKNQIGSIYRKHLVEQANAKRVFNECGTINVTVRDGINVDNIEDECLNDAIMCGAEDIEVHNAAERQVSFLCHPQSFSSVRHKLETMGHKIERSECIFYPNSELVQLNESELVDYQKFKNKLMKLEGFDEIYDNLDDDDENP